MKFHCTMHVRCQARISKFDSLNSFQDTNDLTCTTFREKYQHRSVLSASLSPGAWLVGPWSDSIVHRLEANSFEIATQRHCMCTFSVKQLSNASLVWSLLHSRRLLSVWVWTLLKDFDLVGGSLERQCDRRSSMISPFVFICCATLRSSLVIFKVWFVSLALLYDTTYGDVLCHPCRRRKRRRTTKRRQIRAWQGRMLPTGTRPRKPLLTQPRTPPPLPPTASPLRRA